MITRAQRKHVQDMLRNQPGLSNVTISRLARVSERFVRNIKRGTA